MTYACPAWEFAADSHLSKLQRLQNNIFRTIGNFPRRTSVHDLHKDFKLPHIYDYMYNEIVQAASRNHTKS
jgi:flagellin-specific chaperone FliS